MNTETQHDNITLCYRQGSSDQVYQAAIEPHGLGFALLRTNNKA